MKRAQAGIKSLPAFLSFTYWETTSIILIFWRSSSTDVFMQTPRSSLRVTLIHWSAVHTGYRKAFPDCLHQPSCSYTMEDLYLGTPSTTARSRNLSSFFMASSTLIPIMFNSGLHFLHGYLGGVFRYPLWAFYRLFDKHPFQFHSYVTDGNFETLPSSSMSTTYPLLPRVFTRT